MSAARAAGTALEMLADEQRVQLRFPGGWLEEHPLTGADLREEREQLAAVNVRLDID